MAEMPSRTQRDAGWHMVKVGLYIDPEGFGHVFPDEICAELGWPYTEENYLIIIEGLLRLLPPGMPLKLIRHERIPDA